MPEPSSLTSAYSYPLVVLSVVISVLASFTSLDLAGRGHLSSHRGRLGWLFAAAAAMGAGIWAMHFIAMLAMSLPVPVSYGLSLTLLSFVFAVIGTASGFVLAASDRADTRRVLASGIPMGIGIVAMHYTGMAAMQMPAVIHYDPVLVIVSIAIAVAASSAALWLAFREIGLWRRGAAAGVMGMAVSGMHYTGMAAAHFIPHVLPPASVGPLDTTLLAIGVSMTTFFILTLALVASIFDRQLAEKTAASAAALADSERRFRAYFDHAPDPLVIAAVGEDGAVQYERLNPTAERLSGVSDEKARGKSPIDIFGEESGAQLERLYKACIARGVPMRLEHEIVFPAGARSLETILVPLPHGSSRTVQVMASSRDLTERKATEARMLESQRIEAVGKLTGGVAHDFNNLLTVILGNLDLATRRAGEDMLLRRTIDGARNAAERGAQLVTHLLAFSRRQRLAPETIDVDRLLRRSQEIIRRVLGENIIALVETPSDLWPVAADPMQLELSILNLAINARDAMPGGGTVTLAARNVGTWHRGRPTELEGDHVMIVISDTGPGMAPEVAARAFEPFFTTKEPGKGTGLGLSQVYGFAKQSGGAARIETAMGGGAAVTIFLPRAAPSPAHGTSELHPASPSVHRNRSATGSTSLRGSGQEPS